LKTINPSTTLSILRSEYMRGGRLEHGYMGGVNLSDNNWLETHINKPISHLSIKTNANAYNSLLADCLVWDLSFVAARGKLSCSLSIKPKNILFEFYRGCKIATAIGQWLPHKIYVRSIDYIIDSTYGILGPFIVGAVAGREMKWIVSRMSDTTD